MRLRGDETYLLFGQLAGTLVDVNVGLAATDEREASANALKNATTYLISRITN